MNPPQAGLYFGRVTHLRLAPRRHKFVYRSFYVLLNLDRLERSRTRLFSINRANLLSFREVDHLRSAPESLRTKADAVLVQAGLDPSGWTILLLCMPRMLGYAFNPISIYFCYNPTGMLACLLYEVRNTFGQRHIYAIPVERPDSCNDEPVRQTCEKSFYVSPFMDMDMTYSFRIRPPGEDVAIGIMARRGEKPVISTLFSGQLKPLSDGVILRAALLYPLLTLKVIAAIHWEALRLWLKGMRIVPRPQGPRESLSFVRLGDGDFHK